MMNRADLLATLLLLAFAPLAAAEPPNFVFINIDDLGYADIGPSGSEINRTPKLDRMAAEGRKLTCFYAAPVCSPSRSSLMTGCYPKRVGIPKVLFPGEATGLNPDEQTLPELLKAQGYATACVGKWHLGDQPEFLPTRHGFDSYFGIPYSNDMGPAADGARSDFGMPLPTEVRTNHPPIPLLRNEKLETVVKAAEQTTLVRRYTDEALRFLAERKDGPFFLYLAHSAVHFPLYPGDDFRGRSPHGLYSDWVEEVDASVGEVLASLRDRGLAEKTLVIFTSDNGGTRRGVNTPLRGFKATTFEGGMRVPTIAWWPGRVPAGTATDEVTGMIDVLPTFVSLAGGELPEGRPIDGRNVWPLLAGEPDSKSPHDHFLYFAAENLKAVRQGRWKLDLGPGRLYDLAADVGETTDLSRSHPEVVTRLRRLADEAKREFGDGEPGPACRPPGRVTDPQPIVAHDGTVRAEFSPK